MEFIPLRFTTPTPPRWVFPAGGEERIQAIWDRAGLTPEQKRSLNDPARRRVEPSAIVILPDPALVLALTSGARATIYTALAAFPANVVQSDPFRFPAGASDEWLGDVDLPEPIVALTKRLLYRRGGNECFSDHEIVLQQLPPEQRGRYVKGLSRKSSLIVQLRVRHGADADALARYWGTGRRSKDIEPILQSLAMRPNGGVLDIVHLLPPFARRLLYTFPMPSDDQTALDRDCHWTSFNFYQDPPDDRLTDLGFVQRVLSTDFYPVSGQPVFGDVLMFLRSGNQVVHSCVYLADNIVFTKNGAAFSIPWQLAELDQVRAFYSLEDVPLEVRCYRRKNP